MRPLPHSASCANGADAPTNEFPASQQTWRQPRWFPTADGTSPEKVRPIWNEPSWCSLSRRIVPKIHPRKRPQRLPPALGPFFPALATLCTNPGGIARCLLRAERRCGGPRSVEPHQDLAEGTFALLQRRPVLGGGQPWILEKVLCFGCLACRCRSFCCWHCFGTIKDDEPSPRMKVVALFPHAAEGDQIQVTGAGLNNVRSL